MLGSPRELLKSPAQAAPRVNYIRSFREVVPVGSWVSDFPVEYIVRRIQTKVTLMHIHRNVALNQWNHIYIYFPLTQGSSLKSTQVSKYIFFLPTFIWFQDTDMPRKSNKRGALVPTSPTLHGLKSRAVALRHQNPLRTGRAHRVGTLPGVSAPVGLWCISNRLPGDAVAAAWRTDAIKKCELNKWSETTSQTVLRWTQQRALSLLVQFQWTSWHLETNLEKHITDFCESQNRWSHLETCYSKCNAQTNIGIT